MDQLDPLRPPASASGSIHQSPPYSKATGSVQGSWLTSPDSLPSTSHDDKRLTEEESPIELLAVLDPNNFDEDHVGLWNTYHPPNVGVPNGVPFDHSPYHDDFGLKALTQPHMLNTPTSSHHLDPDQAERFRSAVARVEPSNLRVSESYDIPLGNNPPGLDGKSLLRNQIMLDSTQSTSTSSRAMRPDVEKQYDLRHSTPLTGSRLELSPESDLMNDTPQHLWESASPRNTFDISSLSDHDIFIPPIPHWSMPFETQTHPTMSDQDPITHLHNELKWIPNQKPWRDSIHPHHYSPIIPPLHAATRHVFFPEPFETPLKPILTREEGAASHLMPSNPIGELAYNIPSHPFDDSLTMNTWPVLGSQPDSGIQTRDRVQPELLEMFKQDARFNQDESAAWRYSEELLRKSSKIDNKRHSSEPRQRFPQSIEKQFYKSRFYQEDHHPRALAESIEAFKRSNKKDKELQTFGGKMPHWAKRIRKGENKLKSETLLEPRFIPYMNELSRFIQTYEDHQLKSIQSDSLICALSGRIEMLTYEFLRMQAHTAILYEVELTDQRLDQISQKGFDWILRVWEESPLGEIRGIESFSMPLLRDLREGSSRSIITFNYLRWMEAMNNPRPFLAYLVTQWMSTEMKTWSRLSHTIAGPDKVYLPHEELLSQLEHVYKGVLLLSRKKKS